MQDLPVEAAGTIAHELLHTWNGEAFRPTCMANWDYRRENPCALLWFVEGVSSYYATVILARAGILSQDEFLRWISRAVSCHEDQPLRASESLEEAAVAEWVRPVENLDYYRGGEVVGFLLDTTIRVRTGGVRSLDDVMRALYGASRRRGYRGYGDADLVRTIRAASGLDLGPVLVKWTKEAAEIDYGAVLAGSGLEQYTHRLDQGGCTNSKGEKQIGASVVAHHGANIARLAMRSTGIATRHPPERPRRCVGS